MVNMSELHTAKTDKYNTGKDQWHNLKHVKRHYFLFFMKENCVKFRWVLVYATLRLKIVAFTLGTLHFQCIC